MWVTDAAADRLFAYHFPAGGRVPERDVPLDAANGSPRGLWSDGTTMWVTDTGAARSLFAYRLSDTSLAGVYTLNAANSAPRGIWSDGTTVWVSDGADARVYAYRLPQPPAAGTARSALQRQVALELASQLVAAGHRVPQGIWSNGIDMHIWDPASGRPRSYPLPARVLTSQTEPDSTGTDTNGTGEPAQPVPEPDSTADDIAMRDALIAEQENLLNVYRCMFQIDTHAVPGGCQNDQPAQNP
ncbi:MAG: hypothetical protein F4067_00865 [Acidimicrobiia bacterium]|nr:hypothetical protein [Acidimicrobiia bacterium]MYJ31139.1 hypothetical protein [Acidimicrobiia bacterium]